MRRLLSTRTLALAGVVALASAALWSTIGTILYGNAMVPNLLAELAGVSVEIGVVILIVERLTAAHRRRQSAFAYQALSDRAAVTFVDVMRLLWIRSHASALQFNGDRYDEFYGLVGLHLAEYRSNIEGFAGSLDPASHEVLRRIDRRLSWAASKLAAKPTAATGRLDFAELMRETASMLAGFLEDNGGSSYQTEANSVDAALRVSRSMHASDGEEGPQDLFVLRLQTQDALVTDRGGSRHRPPGVWYDADNDLAIAYFLIDYHLLMDSRTIG